MDGKSPVLQRVPDPHRDVPRLDLVRSGDVPRRGVAIVPIYDPNTRVYVERDDQYLPEIPFDSSEM